MIVLDIQQGTDEWHKARIGIPTASDFDKIITTKGEPSKQAQKYMNKLAGERVTGVPAENFKSGYMDRGNVVEEEARDYYDLITDSGVVQVGLVYGDERKSFSCSPDGLIGEDGGLEIKCPAIHTQVEYLLKNKVPTEYFIQSQGNLLVTGRKWWDFLSYYPGLKPLLIRVNRDEQFISVLKNALEVFCKELESVVSKIK